MSIVVGEAAAISQVISSDVGAAAAMGAGAAAGAAAVSASSTSVPAFTFTVSGVFELVKWLIGSAFSVMFVIGPVTAYAPQYQDIAKGQGEAFSTLISLVMLTANILRLFFWIGKRFEMVLMYQSVVMIFVQLAMLEVCVRMRYGAVKHKARAARTFTDWDWSQFWAWHDFSSYVQFLLCFTGVFGALSLVWIDSEWFVEVLGFLALSIESTIGFPQVYANWKRGPAGLSVWLIGNWLVGDITKTLFYFWLSAPMQFAFSGTVQTVTDVYIIWQIWRYRVDQQTAAAAAAANRASSASVVAAAAASTTGPDGASTPTSVVNIADGSTVTGRASAGTSVEV